MKLKAFKSATSFMNPTSSNSSFKITIRLEYSREVQSVNFKKSPKCSKLFLLLPFFKNGPKPLKLTKIFKNQHLPWIFFMTFQDSIIRSRFPLQFSIFIRFWPNSSRIGFLNSFSPKIIKHTLRLPKIIKE